MRVAAYVRVSTSRQVKLQTIEQQLEMACKYARQKGWELPEEDIFRDDGYSGTTLNKETDRWRPRKGSFRLSPASGWNSPEWPAP